MIQKWLVGLLHGIRQPRTGQMTSEQEDLRDEFAFHLTSSAEEQLDSGIGMDESQQIALTRFGNIRSALQECADLPRSRTVFWLRIHQVITVLLIGAVSFLFYQWKYLANSPTDLPEFTLALSGYSIAETRGDIVGSIVDEGGRPLGDANVLVVVKTWPNNGYRQQAYTATSRTDGTFSIEDVYPPNFDYEVQIAAIANGRLLQSQYVSMTQGTLAPIHFRLAASQGLSFRFESDAGEPIKGVAVFPFQRIDSDSQTHCIYFDSAKPIICRSNAAGIVAMPHFLSGEKATVFVQFPAGEWEQRELVIPSGQEAVVFTPSTTHSQS